jgi:hypothetical protein
MSIATEVSKPYESDTYVSAGIVPAKALME